MPTLQKFFHTICFAFILFALIGCGSDSAEQAFLEAVEINQLNVASISIELESGNDVLEAGTADLAIVMAQLDNGGELEVTEKVTLSTSDASVLSVNPSGRVRAKSKDSTVTLWANWADLSASVSLRVSTEDLDSITVAGASDVSVCSTGLEYSASGQYAVGDVRNISNLVDWSVSNVALAEISDSGVLDTYANGSVNVRAERDGIRSMDTIDFALNIRDNLDTITLSPSSAQTITEGDTLQFTATASYDDGQPSQDITTSALWSSSDEDILTIQERDLEAGLATGEDTGSANISASCDDNNPVNSVAVAVTVEAPKTITDVEIRYAGSSADIDLEVGDGPIQLEAFLVYNDNSIARDVTEDSDIEWSATVQSGNSAEVDNDSDKGEVSFSAAGRTEIEVVFDDDTYNFTDTIIVDID